MKTILSCIIGLALLSGCSNTHTSVMPLTNSVNSTAPYTIVWNGTSKAWRYVEGEWQRDVTYDYLFNVVQRRYATVWKSTKHLHRLHSDYDGVAGERDQNMYFEIKYRDSMKNSLISKIKSSLGVGSGISDKGFNEQTIEIELKNISSFAPYSHIRITQQYQYAKGRLIELVELYKREGNVEHPFMKMEEEADIYIKSTLPQSPMIWK
ncbi:MAG: hypothetical protein OCD01_00010 [Fibrobacterales bacterium]